MRRLAQVTILEEITEARRVFREIKILRNLNHVNVLAISEIFAPIAYEVGPPRSPCLP